MATKLRMSAEVESLLPFKRALRVLIVDNTPTDAELMLASLKRAGFVLSSDVVCLPEFFQERLSQADYDVIISDHNLRNWTGPDVLELLRQSGKEIPFIVVTGTLGDEAAVDYIKRGAADYVLKHRLNILPMAVSHALKEKAYHDEKNKLYEQIWASNQEWERTFDSVPDAILILDNESRVSRANRAASDFCGMPFTKMIGKKGCEVLHCL